MPHVKLAILRRRLFTILSVLSLVLCLATLALWARSYYVRYVVDYATDDGSFESETGEQLSLQDGYSVYSDRGCFVYREQVPFYPQPPGFSFEVSDYTLPRRLWMTGRRIECLGFAVTIRNIEGTLLERVGEASIPHWFVALLLAIPPALHLRASVHSRRLHRAGLCRVCGYDLRATPERCPECGHFAAEPQSAVSRPQRPPSH